MSATGTPDLGWISGREQEQCTTPVRGVVTANDGARHKSSASGRGASMPE